MSKSSSRPPALRTTFQSRDDEIDYLVDHLIYWYWRPNKSKAQYYAERLAGLLDNSSNNAVMQHCQHWIAIWEARGDTKEAIRLANQSLDLDRAELECADPADSSKMWFLEDIRLLQEGLFLQADRHLRINDWAAAIGLLREASGLAEKFGVEMDSQSRSLLAYLQSPGFSGEGAEVREE